MSVEIQMPQMGESVTEGTVLEWHVSEGESVQEGDTVVEVSTDKVDAEVPSPASGVISKILAQPDETVQVGAVLAELEPGEDGAAPSGDGAAAATAEHEEETEPTAATAVAEAPAPDDGDSRVTPVARRAAAANGVDLAKVSGSGAGGKVTKADVMAAADGDGDGAGPA